MLKFFRDLGGRCIIFREQGSTDPLGASFIGTTSYVGLYVFLEAM